MCESVWESDGYLDGLAGREPSPPEPIRRSDGQRTSIRAIEYMRGHDRGAQVRRDNQGRAPGGAS